MHVLFRSLAGVFVRTIPDLVQSVQ